MSGGISRFPERFQDFRRDSQFFGEISGVPWRFQGFYSDLNTIVRISHISG